eukprot:SAG31_NODE_10613_length_1117_cov_1.853635_2_plen_154_part_00
MEAKPAQECGAQFDPASIACRLTTTCSRSWSVAICAWRSATSSSTGTGASAVVCIAMCPLAHELAQVPQSRPSGARIISAVGRSVNRSSASADSILSLDIVVRCSQYVLLYPDILIPVAASDAATGTTSCLDLQYSILYSIYIFYRNNTTAGT